MSIKQTIFLLAIVFIGHANAQGTFEIIGTTGTQLEGKKIFITNEHTEYSGIENKILDSCIIKNGSFRFTGSMKNPASLLFCPALRRLPLASPISGLCFAWVIKKWIGTTQSKANTLPGLHSAVFTKWRGLTRMQKTIQHLALERLPLPKG